MALIKEYFVKYSILKGEAEDCVLFNRSTKAVLIPNSISIDAALHLVDELLELEKTEDTSAIIDAIDDKLAAIYSSRIHRSNESRIYQGLD